MFKRFLKIALRNLTENRSFSAINVLGLAIGIACAGFIFLWVESELGFDKFHAKNNQLYSILGNQKYDRYTATFGSTPAPMAPELQADIPGIQNTCRIAESGITKLMRVGDNVMYAKGGYADSSLFNMFTFLFVEGDAQRPFSQLYSIVITQSAAWKLFGERKNIVGKTVRVDNKQDYVVSGVIKDIPENSSIKFEWMAPFKNWYDENEWAKNWNSNCLSTYVELKPKADAAGVNGLLYNFIQQRSNESIVRPFLFPMRDWRLRNKFEDGVQTGGGGIEYVRLFTLIAWIVLLIACINFMNLSTARSEKRAKEVGIRKVLGVSKSRLALQFIGEAIVMALCAALIALVIIWLLLPSFNTLVQKSLSIGIVSNPLHLPALIGVAVICGVVAGSYPSLYLSSFKPVAVLKGLKMKTGKASFVRKGLVVFQFCISIILIISTIVIYQQIQHVKGRNLGFNKNNLLAIEMNDEMKSNFSVIKQEMLNSGEIKSLALSNYNTLYSGNNTGGFTWAGKQSDNQVLISIRYVSPGFAETTGMKIIEGRDFVQTDSIMSNNMNVVISESLEKLMGAGSAIGKTLHTGQGEDATVVTVVGVLNDYMYGDMYGKPDPVMFLCVPTAQAKFLYVRLHSNEKINTTIQHIESVLKKENPNYPFTYYFVDEQYNQMFTDEQLIGKLSTLFASLAIIISCLGLFGLAAYTAERRIKEIGIRKVLGAGVANLAGLLSKEFLQLVVVSFIIAFPLAWWMMNNWLQGYKYRIEISMWIFFVAGISAIFIALATVSFQAIKAALTNPVKSLKTE